MGTDDERIAEQLKAAPPLPPNATGRPVPAAVLTAILFHGGAFPFGTGFLLTAGFYALIVASTGHVHWFDPYMLSALVLLGLALAVSGMAACRHEARFLRTAHLAWGVVINVDQRMSEWTERSGKSLVDRHRTMVWEEVQLAFNDSKGIRHRAIIDVKSSEPLTDDRHELVLYDPEYPAHAQAADDPATCIRILPDGTPAPKSSPWRKIAKLLIVSALMAAFAFFLVHH